MDEVPVQAPSQGAALIRIVYGAIVMYRPRVRPLGYQWLRFGLDPFPHLTALEGAEIIPGKHSDTRIKPLPLTNGHGRYMTVAPERTLVSVGKCPLNMYIYSR
jgi:hypothetical protein